MTFSQQHNTAAIAKKIPTQAQDNSRDHSSNSDSENIATRSSHCYFNYIIDIFIIEHCCIFMVFSQQHNSNRGHSSSKIKSTTTEDLAIMLITLTYIYY
jgi:hypothetical protein